VESAVDGELQYEYMYEDEWGELGGVYCGVYEPCSHGEAAVIFGTLVNSTGTRRRSILSSDVVEVSTSRGLYLEAVAFLLPYPYIVLVPHRHCPVWGRGTPLPPVHLLPHLFPFLLFPFFHWLYPFSSFVHPFPFYQNSPTPFPGQRS